MRGDFIYDERKNKMILIYWNDFKKFLHDYTVADCWMNEDLNFQFSSRGQWNEMRAQ